MKWNKKGKESIRYSNEDGVESKNVVAENREAKMGKIRRPVKITSIVCASLLLVGASVYAVGANTIVFGGITESEAKEIALKQIDGATASNITKCKKDFDDVRKEYDVEIIYDGYEYDFEISADDGRILDRSLDIADEATIKGDVRKPGPGKNGSEDIGTSSGISLDRAKAIALSQVPGATSASIIKAYSDYDDGRLEYDIEIRYNSYEYEFEIDGATGSILSRDTDAIKSYSSTGNSTGSSYHDDDDYDDEDDD